MTKRTFLRVLHFALWGGFRRSERHDIIADYEGFFTHGQSNGLSETAVAIELGHPTQIALNLAHESGKRAPVGAMVLKYSEQICVLFGIIISLCSALIYHNTSEHRQDNIALILGVTCLFLMCTALFVALRAKLRTPDFRRGFTALLFSNAVIFALATFCCLFFNSQVSLNFTFWVLENNQSQWITNGSSEIRMVCLIVTMCIGLWAILSVWRGKSERFITAIHAVGFFVYLETVYKIWYALSDIDWYWNRIANANLVYGAALIITVGSVLAVKTYRKGVVKNVK